ncbi:hypothetical protein D9758_013678 [Tetrapyrgos nigripes]|uniref:Uncharacterized protein n=1 Tax=Tetrapyrgos nigripes TaxID=182062 RepID=A0A8H5CKF2_9AGAR|nr:hypothetical protein D9758_013678 [Tetrapyrgos nigripes]
MRRWKHFYYACLNGAELPIDFPIIPLGGSSLEVAEIIISRHDKSWEWFRSLLECSPKLQDLSSSRMDLDTPWHVLKRARLYHRAFIHSVDCRNLLARAPQLECGRFAIPKEPGPNDTMPSTPLLHNLTQLILDTYVPVDALVDSLTLPSLKHFAVHYVHLGPSAPHFSFPNFMSFLTRSSCSLETLELTVSYHANDIITFLEHQAIRDSLKVFRLTGCFRACIDTFISSLIIPWPSDPSSAASHPAERCLVPKLETLELGPPLMTTDGILSEMVLSRMRFGLDPDMACRLKDATLHLTTEAGHEQDLAQLRLLQNTPGRDFDLKIIMNGL